MSPLENTNRDKTILQERVLVEEKGVLTSKRYASRADGTVLREIRVAFCDYGGERLSDAEQTLVCCQDQVKLCKSHAIRYLGKYYCPDCLQQALPLSRLQFKILHGLIKEIEGLHDIKDLTRSKKEDFDSALDRLRDSGYLEKKGISLFSYYEVTDHGVLAWRTYLEAFADGDVLQFMEEVERHLEEVKQSVDKKHVGNSR